MPKPHIKHTIFLRVPCQVKQIFTIEAGNSLKSVKKAGPASWPGFDLTLGVSGSKVTQIQEQLNAIADAYPALPKVTVDGIYGKETQNAVRIFQGIFGLGETGIVDYLTWYKIQEIYVAVSRIAELN